MLSLATTPQINDSTTPHISLMRKTTIYTISDTSQFKRKLLQWANRFEEICWLDSNDYQQEYSSYDAVLAVDVVSSLRVDYKNAFQQLEQFRKQAKDYLFGYLTYDLKNDVEDLTSKNKDSLHFSDLFFFQPKKIFFLKGNTLEVKYHTSVFEEIEEDMTLISNVKEVVQQPQSKINIQSRISKSDYQQKFETIIEHIHRGDIYEVNFCQEFYAENAHIHPLEVYQNLNAISSTPFACFLKQNNKYALCASPERYLYKNGYKVVSQPIKGTSKRSKNEEEDAILKEKLVNNIKERAENTMIVDLVRNDLSKIAQKGTVEVEELCEPYTFQQVHQLISTISCGVDTTVSPIEIIKATFPMGSMTGAPKISAMEIIERVEETCRGLYSGAIGYFSPDGCFDFNVVIRSILYNNSSKYVSYSVGGAITAKSSWEQEYEECMTKANAMKRVLGGV